MPAAFAHHIKDCGEVGCSHTHRKPPSAGSNSSVWQNWGQGGLSS